MLSRVSGFLFLREMFLNFQPEMFSTINKIFLLQQLNKP